MAEDGAPVPSVAPAAPVAPRPDRPSLRCPGLRNESPPTLEDQGGEAPPVPAARLRSHAIACLGFGRDSSRTREDPEPPSQLPFVLLQPPPQAPPLPPPEPPDPSAPSGPHFHPGALPMVVAPQLQPAPFVGRFFAHDDPWILGMGRSPRAADLQPGAARRSPTRGSRASRSLSPQPMDQPVPRARGRSRGRDDSSFKRRRRVPHGDGDGSVQLEIQPYRRPPFHAESFAYDDARVPTIPRSPVAAKLQPKAARRSPTRPARADRSPIRQQSDQMMPRVRGRPRGRDHSGAKHQRLPHGDGDGSVELQLQPCGRKHSPAVPCYPCKVHNILVALYIRSPRAAGRDMFDQRPPTREAPPARPMRDTLPAAGPLDGMCIPCMLFDLIWGDFIVSSVFYWPEPVGRAGDDGPREAVPRARRAALTAPLPAPEMDEVRMRGRVGQSAGQAPHAHGPPCVNIPPLLQVMGHEEEPVSSAAELATESPTRGDSELDSPAEACTELRLMGVTEELPELQSLSLADTSSEVAQAPGSDVKPVMLQPQVLELDEVSKQEPDFLQGFWHPEALIPVLEILPGPSWRLRPLRPFELARRPLTPGRGIRSPSDTTTAWACPNMPTRA
jgi:hypothetical protein